MEQGEEKKETLELEEEVKRFLDITWDDEDTKKSINEYIKYAKQDLSNLVGTEEIDFEKDILARELLLNHCRYQRNKDIEFFEDNFLKKIRRLQLNYACNDLKESENIEI